MARLTVVTDIAAVATMAAERVSTLLGVAMPGRGTRSIVLSGGHTPRRLYECLADPAQPWKTRIDWSSVELFWGDERNVPPDDADSNFGLANRALIQHVEIPAQQVHRMRGELSAVEAAREYDALLHQRARNKDALFDVVLLGIGTDAHIASLFPDSPVLAQTHTDDTTATEHPNNSSQTSRELASGVFVPAVGQWRVTLTPRALLSARAIVVLAAGAEKADAVVTAIQGKSEIGRHPAQLLRAADERVEWIIDEAAARQLS